MENPPKEEKNNPTAEELAKARPKPDLTESEKEVAKARVAELEAENAALKKENEELKKPKTEPKKKSFLSDFNPLN